MRPPLRILDLCCGSGGCAMGYSWAGFDVVGVDIAAHRDYPFPMFVTDAIRFIEDGWLAAGNFDAVHASPPCPRYSSATPAKNRDKHPDLVPVVRKLLRESGLPYVIENVPGAPLEDPITLCGSMFHLGVRRHRLFESNIPLVAPRCNHGRQAQVWGVYGDHGDLNPVTRPDGSSRGNKARDAQHAREVMGAHWIERWDDLADAIPPAYTDYIGRQLVDHIDQEMAS